MAVTFRRMLSTAGRMLAWAWLLSVCSGLAAAQPGGGAPAPNTALDPASFLRLAHSSAVLQSRAAELAASRDTRPEARAFATKMVEFRREQIPKLEAIAREHRIDIPAVQDFEHQVILENLEPLDFLALSRRYTEVQVQALEQEVHGYGSGESSPEGWVQQLAKDTRPRLRELLDEARKAQLAVAP